jgi:pimeloyl-ACP methyl ester carboxylesterase
MNEFLPFADLLHSVQSGSAFDMGYLSRFHRLSTVVRASIGSQLADIPLFTSPRMATRIRRAKDAMSAVREYSDLQYPYSVKMAVLQVQGYEVEVAYIDEYASANNNTDTQEVILFLHGLGSYIPAWRKNIDVLRHRYRCIALDMPGYGRSSKLAPNGESYPYSMKFFADVAVQLLNRLNIYQVTLCGHSMGGQISMSIALAVPERIKRLALIASAGLEQFSERDMTLLRKNASAASVRDASPAEIRTSYKLNFYRMPADAELMIAERLALRSARDFPAYCAAQEGSIKAMIDGQVRHRLGDLHQPTLIIYGEQDALIPNPLLHGGTPRDVARSASALIPNSRVVMIPRCGHFAQFEQPDAINQALINFVA